jgi:hypothetical protein
MRTKLPFLAAVVSLLCASSPSASADPITVNFVVAVEFAKGPLEELFGVPIRVGDRLPGRFTFDPSTPDRNTLLILASIPGAGIRYGSTRAPA